MVKLKKVKLVGCLLLLALTYFLVACGGTKNEPQVSKQTKQEEPQKDNTASNYPNKPITMVVWTSPGSPVDVTGRQLAKIGEKYFKQSIPVINKTGGSGAVAMAYVQSQPADGYTLLMTTSSMVTSMAGGEVEFTPDDFDYIIRVAKDPYVIAVRTESPFKTLKDLVDYAKKNPGKIQMAGGLTGGAQHVSNILLQKAAGIELTWVPFEGQADAVAACLGGHADAVQGNSNNIKPQVEAGKLRVIGVSGDKRLDDFPDAPTYKELGYDREDYLWRGVMLKGGTPSEIIAKLRATFKQIYEDPEFQTYLKNTNQIPGYVEPAQMKDLIKKEVEETRSTLIELGVIKKK
ncbi:Bordetella uptake gene [Moorella glycerini]|uniref:Tripartite tricarboxylate transporter family receptor n=1 Tax=Neomoorella stamsii TaxID=1266720 RepID=A0A9X7J643_9FIRM|nr:MULTISPECIES: tripartite tricarboxylate transporter substrate binding protein [Moorella]PRR76426.1 Tripartite tricarboxylate transporter family receptor [Moorella stamsii]CEP67005.1 Bordetella uptake gene [Moorella glycerini]